MPLLDPINLSKSSDNQKDAILGAVNAGITFVPTHLDETTSYIEISLEMQGKVRIPFPFPIFHILNP